MNISNTGLALIKKYEGLRLTAYKAVSTEKYWTIGYGHYGADVTAGMTITEAEAEEYLKKDVATAEKAVSSIGKPFNQNQFDALVSFTYNCGSGNLNTLCRDRDIPTIGEKIILYNKAGGIVLNGLVRRRTEEQALYNTPIGECSASTKVPDAASTMPTIRKGSKGEAVCKLQQALLEHNFKSCVIDGKKKYLTADGDWGMITDSIFRRWQSYKGLTADGICGPKSWTSLGY